MTSLAADLDLTINHGRCLRSMAQAGAVPDWIIKIDTMRQVVFFKAY